MLNYHFRRKIMNWPVESWYTKPHSRFTITKNCSHEKKIASFNNMESIATKHMERVIAQLKHLNVLQSCNRTWMLNERQLIALDSYAIDNRTNWACLCASEILLHSNNYWMKISRIKWNEWIWLWFLDWISFINKKTQFLMTYLYTFLAVCTHTDFSTFLVELIKCLVKLFNSLLTLNETLHSNLLKLRSWL